jgi:hypothetical protein
MKLSNPGGALQNVLHFAARVSATHDRMRIFLLLHVSSLERGDAKIVLADFCRLAASLPARGRGFRQSRSSAIKRSAQWQSSKSLGDIVLTTPTVGGLLGAAKEQHKMHNPGT